MAMTLAAPAFAQQEEMDITSITCAEFGDMDEQGQLAAAAALVERLASGQSASSARVRLDSICGSNEGSTALIVAATSGMSMDD
ncbi:HdeA/HdeB family chaperone [Roseivivax halodurans]|nr:hypothetical protein [Roseivivax halodurans]